MFFLLAMQEKKLPVIGLIKHLFILCLFVSGTILQNVTFQPVLVVVSHYLHDFPNSWFVFQVSLFLEGRAVSFQSLGNLVSCDVCISNTFKSQYIFYSYIYAHDIYRMYIFLLYHCFQ